MNRQDVMERLIEIQNHKIFWNVDILTITGFMKTTSEVLHHLMRCKRQIENAA
jgi:hypothetical protein